MNPIGVLPFASMLASVAGRSLIVAVAASALPNTADVGVPTAKEQALMEHACRSVQAGAAHDAFDRCLEARLLSLRADFGRDLTRLSESARAKIDATCSPAQALRGRDGYLDCLSGQLASLAARARAMLPAQRGTAPPVSDAAPVSVDSPASGSQESSLLTVRTAAAAVAIVVVAGALVFFGMRARRVRHVCRVCGVGVDLSADLCPGCRHAAAEAIRRAANDRAEQRRAAEAEERRQQEEAGEQRREEQRRDEQEQRRRLDEERRAQEELARRDEIARGEAEERQRAAAAVSSDASESVFDPYLALGVAPGASDEEVRAAYEEAKVRYDPEEVAHLGYDAKQHFAVKSRAIERAYQMVAGSLQGR
jgi:hypothetical protein